MQITKSKIIAFMVYREEKIVRVLLRNFNQYRYLLLLLLLLLSCKGKDTLPFYNSADFTPVWDIETITGPVHRIADFSFINQDSQVVSNKTFDDKIYVANFFFTSCPGICPKMTINLKHVADQFKKSSEVLFISHSVTPWLDSVSQLNEFAHRHEISSRQWHLVTGDQIEINELARNSYFAEEIVGLTKGATEFLHSEHCLLIDRKRRIRGIYNGTLPLEMERLAADIWILMAE